LLLYLGPIIVEESESLFLDHEEIAVSYVWFFSDRVVCGRHDQNANPGVGNFVLVSDR